MNPIEVLDSTQNKATQLLLIKITQMNALCSVGLFISEYERVLWNKKPISPDRR